MGKIINKQQQVWFIDLVTEDSLVSGHSVVTQWSVVKVKKIK